jgi:7,8-dihydropterin-6-yl-methyl-4-(beta-D-ribofuranosyl)aminobenzene 5'-phosphate synthase
MSFRISPLWWPVLAVASPVLVPGLLLRNRRFQRECVRVGERNRERMDGAEPLEMPEVDFLELTVLVEWEAREGFLGDPGVSYLFKTDLGSMLFDIGFGATRPAFTHNTAKLGFTLDQAEALTISHLHHDHMGGMSAMRSRQVTVPEGWMPSEPMPCFLPDTAEADGFHAQQVTKPQLLAAGMASTGPLARSFFLLGTIEEQAVLVRVKDKGLVVFTGCGHPTIEVILEMAGRLSNEPLYAIGGGLHFPVTDARDRRAGLQLPAIAGTGKPPWRRITDEDLSRTINALNAAAPKKVYLSAHDTCDHALERMKRELEAETEVLEAGASYHL